MKFLYAALFIVALMFTACDSGSSSDESSPYGDLRYERHLPGRVTSADCYVYSEGVSYTVVMEQHLGIAGTITVISQLELDMPTKIHEEVNMLGVLSSDTPMEFCKQEREVYETSMGGTVTCSKSKVTADAVIDEDVEVSKLEEARKTAVVSLALSCDEFIDDFENQVLSEE